MKSYFTVKVKVEGLAKTQARDLQEELISFLLLSGYEFQISIVVENEELEIKNDTQE